MKKLLLVYPVNFFCGGNGTNNRVHEVVKLFKEIGFTIDLISYKNFPTSDFSDYETQNKNGLIKKLYLCDFNSSKTSVKKSLLRKILNRLKYCFVKFTNPQLEFSNWVRADLQNTFDKIVKQNNYDVIVLVYSYLAGLFTNRNITAKKVYLLEDIYSLQQYWSEQKTAFGKLLDEEISRISVMDEIFCISYDEKILFEKLLNKEAEFLPHLLPKETNIVSTDVSKRSWDIFFIGFNNSFNNEGLNWFLKEVYPYLNKNLKILLVGSMTESMKITHSNIEVVAYVEDLNTVYEDSKVSICPLFKGTGMKIKVIEAMSKGLPVVCTDRGVDGFPDKKNNGCLVTNNPKEFADYINKLVSERDYYNSVQKKVIDYYKLTFDREHYTNVLKKKFCNIGSGKK